ncbi:MAG: Unknown protein [uncultured Sulfurovum sp.]|uniref:Porin n=1 Tax=uncultured Sulfurovum sp. TaxID=269237 RepID=A0A6S6S0C0_9BACT|nr:MAG: Unknown protein [uncultured Sulfurovum sp.]
MYKKLLIGSAILASTLTLQATELDELNAKLDALTEEIAQIKEKESDSSVNDKLSFGGYGKMDYTNYQDKSTSSNLDIYRAILYVGYQFTDNIKFVSEIEWEHGGRESTGGYSVVEQAYLDFKLNNNAAIKVGHMIVPVGMVNLYHEPTTFHSVSRPEVEKYIVPSTWHENGAVVHGSMNNFDYQVGIIAGLDASEGTEVRGMRQSGQKSKADDFAFVARADYKSNVGFNVGASVFTGEAGHDNTALSDVKTTIAEVHAGYNLNNIHINGLYAQSKVSDASAVAISNASTASGKGSGYYVTAAYDVTNEWSPFVQYEKYNRFDEKFDATGASTASGKDIVNTTIGVNYKPTPNVVLKANYVMRDNAGVDDDRIELGTGYVF